MANQVLYYFYAPTWDFPPNGPIKLGNVIASLKKPERPLYVTPSPDDSEVFSTTKTHVEYSREKSRSGKFSILTKFLSFLGVGVDVGADWELSEEEMYSFDRLETNQFFPKDNYIQKCVEADPVRRYLDKARYRKSVYVITGIKTVHGAKAKSIKHRVIGGNLGVEVDGTLLSGGMVPVGGGPDTDVKVGKKISTNFEGGSDFVFAFRVKKVTVTRKTGVVKADEDYKKGAMLEKDETELDVPQLLVSKLDDPYPEDEGFEGEELTEDDAIVACAIPKTVDDEDMA